MTQIRIIAPKKWSNDKRGEFFEKEISKFFKKMRCEVIDRIRFTGMEIDLLVKNKDTNKNIFVECKFWSQPFQAGVITDLLGKALVRRVEEAYLFSTSKPGKEACGLIEEIKKQNDNIEPKFVFIDPEALMEWYIDVLDIPSIRQIIDKLSDNEFLGETTLVVTPWDYFWALEKVDQGIPSKLIIFPIDNRKYDFDADKQILIENELWDGLLFENGCAISKKSAASSIIENESIPAGKEAISQIPVADQFDDYRPCRPQDFVGRSKIQKEIWEYLEKVRNNETKTRIISLIGPSGFGKSSLILKISSRFKNKYWKNKFYLYDVDTRSAITPTFIFQAIVKAFNEAKNAGFIILDEEIKIDSYDDILSSISFQKALSYLKKNQKVLVIFFDQFEEMFVKEELLKMFDIFKKTSLQIDSIQENLVIGCSWRTGISFPENHPAYHMWQELKDRRLEFEISGFDSRERSELLTLLSKTIDEPLEYQLRRKLSEQSLGYPWLLKKFCIHVVRQKRKGISQIKLLTSQININQLFDEDTEDLSDVQLQCLKYIAQNSPVDFVNLSEIYDKDTINRLTASRLIVRTGHKIAIYWDIFKDYILDKKLPVIPLTIIPSSYAPTILRSIKLFRDLHTITAKDLAIKLNYTNKSIKNVISDLATFLIIRRIGEQDEFQLSEEFSLIEPSKEYIYFFNQFRDHIIIKKILDDEGDNCVISLLKFVEFVRQIYSSLGVGERSINAYSSRMMQWFSYSGLIQYEDNLTLRLCHTGNGRDRGVMLTRRLGSPHSTKLLFFMASSSPEKVMNLIQNVKIKNRLDRKWINENGFRNAMYDACSLGILYWENNHVEISSDVKDSIKSASSEYDIYKIINLKMVETPFIIELLKYKDNKNMSNIQIGTEISKKLNKRWSKKSYGRIISAGFRWIRVMNDINQKKRTQQTKLI